MIDPKAAEIASEAMRKMSPAQVQEMMRSMPNLSPDMIQQAQSQMASMKPEDWDRVRAQLAGMSPEQLSKQAADMKTHLSAQQQYVRNASQQLKAEGNQLHSSGKYTEAVEKYSRARSNMSSHSDQEAQELCKACTLNLSSCYLNLKQYDKCIVECNLVLAGEADNLKALYRRGQAYLGSQQWQAAAEDLERAVRLSNHDPQQQQLIKEKLQHAKDQLSMLRAQAGIGSQAATDSSFKDSSQESRQLPAADDQQPRSHNLPKPAAGIPSSSDKTSSPLDMQTTNKSNVDAGAAQPSSLNWSTAPPVGAHPTPEGLEHVAKMMAENPSMLQMATEMVSKLSPEQLADISRQSGLPTGLNPDLAKQAAEQLSKMSPYEIQQMSQFARQAQHLSTSTSKPSAATSQANAPSAARADALSPPSTSASLGSTLSPDMMKMATDMMANMKPEDMARMQQLSASMGAGMSSTIGQDDAMAQMMNNPALMENAMAMMRSMDEKSLASMMQASGMCRSPEQAEAMAKQVKGMNDAQMKVMMKAAQAVQTGARAFQRIKAFVLSHYLLVAAIIILVLAVLLRAFNIM